jgi:two-component system sensor histidine kinase AtoS
MASAIIDGTKALEKLVLGILHYARPVSVNPVSKDLGALLKELGKFIKIDPAFPPSVKLSLHIPNDPIFAPIDPDSIKRALLNLAFNAIEAMPQGGTLSFSLFKLEGCCQIAIADTGIGMEPEVLKSLFAPCFTTKQKGNGLGLIEAEKIVKAHRGAIDVRSQPGKGSTFTITLPLKR